MTFTAIVNTPGYLPNTEDVPEFDTIGEAWEYLAGERREAEDEAMEMERDYGRGYSEVVNRLECAAERVLEYIDLGLDPDYTGTITGPTPEERIADLGIAYTVTEVTE